MAATRRHGMRVATILFATIAISALVAGITYAIVFAVRATQTLVVDAVAPSTLTMSRETSESLLRQRKAEVSWMERELRQTLEKLARARVDLDRARRAVARSV